MTHHPSRPIPRTGLALAAAAIAALLLAGCGQTENDTRSATQGLPDLEQSLRAHEWLLDPAASDLSATSTNPVTLVFESSDRAVGTAPCNQYGAQVELSGDDGVQFTAISGTTRACEPDVMEAEQAYLDALAQVRTADATDRNRLVLEGDGVKLTFSTFDLEANLEGEWDITNHRRGDTTTGAIVSPVAGTTPTITFDADRSVVIATGCNSLRSSWRLDGDLITIDQPAQTMMACDQPAGVMEQEAALATALTAADRVQLTPTTLTLLDEDGAIVLVARQG